MSVYPPPGMLGPRAIAWWALRTQSERVRLEGFEHVPGSGPVLIAARHYHHLLDGAVLVQHLARPLHLVVGLDWTSGASQRRWMERACALAQWPVVVRGRTAGERAGYQRREALAYVRRGLRAAAGLLAAGRVVVMFPEGYPAIDPTPWRTAPVRDRDGFLPFSAGLQTVARLAARAGAPPAIVPVGFRYESAGSRWRITARAGAPLACDASPASVESAVRLLSAP